MALMEWSDELCLKLINEVRGKRVIWDPKDPQKKNRNKKNDAVAAIAVIFDTTSGEIIRKWKNLTQSYRVYRRRCRKFTTGMGADEVYKPTWFAYDALNDFMNDVYAPQATIDTMVDGEKSAGEDSDYHDAQDEEYHEDNPSPVNTNTDEGNNASTSSEAKRKSPPKKQFKSPKKVVKRKNPQERSEDPRVTEAYDYLISKKKKEESALSNKIKDECDIFGEFVATQLKKEDAETRELMMHEIHKVMYDIKRSKTYNRSSAMASSQHSSSVQSFLGTAEFYNYPHPPATSSPNFSTSVSPISSHSYSNPPTPLSSIYPQYSPISSETVTLPPNA